MFSKSYYSLFLSFAFLVVLSGQAQQLINVDYSIKEVTKSEVRQHGEFQINAYNYKLYKIDVEQIRMQLEGIGHVNDEPNTVKALIDFPHPDGEFRSYESLENTTMSSGLAGKYPRIQAFDATNAAGSTKVKWDITEQGLHVMIMRPGRNTIFIDPVIKGNTEYYIVYKKEDFYSFKEMECHLNEDFLQTEKEFHMESAGRMATFGNCVLKTYRLALSATGEYTTFHGGTVAQALSAQVTSMNRVNGVFERDMAITMEIIPNNDSIVYVDASTDPFTNGQTFQMINQNQTNTDLVIGSANYDIGHVFGTNSGGLASLGSVCANGSKARGVTGGAFPIGDPFDIDYVAHEMGHQYGANHTQNNNCNRNSATAVEPGSASTIMGYAGICSPNVQNNSDDYFHGVSLEEFHYELQSNGPSASCGVVWDTLNNAGPDIISTTGDIEIPHSTGFVLRSSVNDPDGDTITYCWEQMDNEVFYPQPPLALSNGGPNFRSLDPRTDSLQYFPRLSAIVNGNTPTWQVLASVGRVYNFRLTVRDNSYTRQGCNDHEDILVTVEGTAGPFDVTSQDTLGEQWFGTGSALVEWDPANTDIVLGVTQVDIFLSFDGGASFPHQLADDVPNSGSAVVTVPNTATTEARVMVMNSGHYFYDVNQEDFEIVESGIGMAEVVEDRWLVVPNPNNGSFELQLDEERTGIEIEVYNTLGQLVQRVNHDGLSRIPVIYKGASGIYFLHVKADGFSKVFRMVKE
jgi:hypothetical protein